MAQPSDSPHNNLPLLAEKRLPFSFETAQTAYCDIYDLIAITRSETSEVVVYRAINGQVAFTAKYPDPYEESTPKLISWKADGTLLGVGWEDGVCCLYSGEDGRVVGRVSGEADAGEGEWRVDLEPAKATDVDEGDAGDRMVKCLAWTRHRRMSGAPAQSGKIQGGMSTEDWFDGVASEDGSGFSTLR